MKKPGKPSLSKPKPPAQSRPSLARLVGGLPLPPKLPKPPVPRIMKPLLVAPPKPSASKPRPAQPQKPASSSAARPSVAGKLGAFLPKPTRASAGSSPKKKRR